jgi:hypothetical protein
MQPEEYLDAADEVGMLVKYDAGAPLAFQRGGPGELPAGITSGEKHRLVAEQWSAILHWTQNHPSLIIYSTGSELKADPLLTELHRMAKRKDRTRLVLSWADETDVFESGVGLSEPLDPSEEIHRRLRSHGVLPHLIHEYGAPESLSSYSAQAAAAAKRLGVEDLFPTFIINSRKLAASTRKLMIEEARKTKGFAGYAMWLIQDIPGYPQGIFDYHWRPKGLAAEKFLQSNGPVALLMHEASCKTRRCFTAGERVTFEVLASNFEDAPIRGELVWRISDRSTGAVLGAGTTSRVKSEPYSSGGLGAVEITMPETARPAAATLSMAVDDEGRRLKNDWPIWLFPKDLLSSAKTKIGIYERSEQALAGIRRVFPFVGGFDQNTDLAISSLMDDRLMKYLLDGGDVMLIVPANHSLWAATETRFQSRWPNSEGGANINATIIRDHSLLADFPHDGYCDYQFYNLIGAGGGGSALKVPSRLHPIVEVFNTDSRAAYLFEARVGKGKLLATTFRFAETVSGFPESAYLFSLLLDYAGGSAFLPQARLTADDIEKFGFAGYVVLDLARGERARIRGACLSGGGLAKYPDSTVGGRRCNWVYAASTPYHTMTLQFKLTEAPSHDLALAVEGAHYPAAGGDKVDIRIAVNGSTLVEGPSEFPTGRFGLRQYRIARELLQEGMNTLSISNLEPKGPAGDAPFFAVDFLEFRIENEPGRHESCTAARSQSAAAESLVDNRRADNSHGDGQREQSDRPSMDPVISCGGAKPWADRSAWRLWSPFRYWADGRLSRS